MTTTTVLSYLYRYNFSSIERNTMSQTKRVNTVATFFHVANQLKWIADHNYESYDSPTSQSNGSVAVYKADVSKLLDYVDHAITYPLYRSPLPLNTDHMQDILHEAVTTYDHWDDVERIVKHYIIEKVEEWMGRSIQEAGVN